MVDKTNINKVGLKCSYKDLTLGMMVYGEKTSEAFKTGEWTSVQPVVDEEKCINCLMCVPVCPDSCITVVDGKRSPFDYDHCKGCGICVKNCPPKAISMKGVK
ncbi:MAG: 4Fe-4S binding protein [Clostridia bacterium]|nr:4Fe-4S binding protein [Clostridia bacterium]